MATTRRKTTPTITSRVTALEATAVPNLQDWLDGFSNDRQLTFDLLAALTSRVVTLEESVVTTDQVVELEDRLDSFGVELTELTERLDQVDKFNEITGRTLELAASLAKSHQARIHLLEEQPNRLRPADFPVFELTPTRKERARERKIARLEARLAVLSGTF